MIYCRVKFPKGAGLGTRLFPWARCILFSHRHEIPMLSPEWVQPRIGPLLRGGIDLRAYHRQILLLGLFQRRQREIGGFRKWQVQRSGRIESEPEALASFSAKNFGQGEGTSLILEFEGARNMFLDVSGWHGLLRQELQAATRQRWLSLAAAIGTVPIGINVRLGNDFRKASTESDYYIQGAIRTPIPWFVESLQQIRQAVGFPARAVVVSDGTEEALRELLAMENVTFLRPGCAISDLLILSNTKILIGSGGSSFSAWASFLGQMPTISHPGQSLEWFKLGSAVHLVRAFDPGNPSDDFLAKAREVLA